VYFNYISGRTLYFARFTEDWDVYHTDGATSELWGTGGRTAADYDVSMGQLGIGPPDARAYVGEFDADGNITDVGTYHIVAYDQLGANPADTDPPIAQGEFYWDGSSEITLGELEAATHEVINVYDDREDGGSNSFSGLANSGLAISDGRNSDGDSTNVAPGAC
jgi:hypothetical protein